MMKSGKDEEKIMGPLFPRLHINDAEKGGPRAPPRNKMALYEQLGIPAPRFTSGSASASMLPLPPNNNGSLVPLTSSSHSGGQKRSLRSPVRNSPASFHLAEKHHSYSSGGMNLSTTSMNLEWQPMKHREYHALNVAGHMSMTANCSFYRPHSISKNSSAKKLGDDDDFKIPSFVRSGRTLNCGNGQKNTDKEKLNASSPNRQLQTSCANQLKQTSSTDLMSRQHMRDQTEENSKMSLSFRDSAKNPASNVRKGEKVLADTSSSPLARGRISGSVKGALVSLNEEKSGSLADASSRLRDPNAQLHDENRASQEKKALRDGVSAEPKKAVGKRNASTLEGVSCSRPPPGDNHGSPNRLENVNECHEDHCGPLQVRDVDRNPDVSDNSIVDSISGVDICPDDVVGVIGQKQFWKARRAIVHQQRVFAVQVFELHRLIKVQRLFAASPDLLLGSELYLGKQVLPVKKLPSANALESPPLIVDPLKPNHNIECAAENALGKLPLPSLNGDTNKGLNTRQSNYKPYLASPPPTSTIIDDAKPAPWCFQPPPGNQWLVPVLSPSEGLVYKPYIGPCPPPASFVAPVYGSCGPMNPTSIGRDLLNTPYSIPASYHQGIGILSNTPLGQTYFLPYGMPLMNPSISSLAIDQASKESEVQGSTTSSLSERRVQGEGLPLFPTVPIVQVLDQPVRTYSTEVIRVVPHNRRSASESAARIFQSIQEERRQHD